MTYRQGVVLEGLLGVVGRFGGVTVHLFCNLVVSDLIVRLSIFGWCGCRDFDHRVADDAVTDAIAAEQFGRNRIRAKAAETLERVVQRRRPEDAERLSLGTPSG